MSSNPSSLYEKGDRIGNGAFATVYIGSVRATGQPVAIKLAHLDRSKGSPEDFYVRVFPSSDPRGDRLHFAFCRVEPLSGFRPHFIFLILMKHEVASLRTCRSPYITELVGAHLWKSDVWIVLE